MMRVLLYATGFFLLASSGLLQGLMANRWGASADLAAAAARCDEVGTTLGDWEAQDVPVDSRQLAVAEVVGHLSRKYTNRVTGQTVTILLLCGRPGPMSVHTPDICYRGSGYTMVGKQENRRCEQNPTVAAEFCTARFSKQEVVPQPLRIFWAWNDGGPWTAPDNPRWTFAASGYLYKLYVIHGLSSINEPLDVDPCLDFFKVLLPELQRCLSPAS
jgi:Protein of unknown function (DUF3485)